MDQEYLWIFFAIFMAIPLTRVILRHIARRRGESIPVSTPQEQPQSEESVYRESEMVPKTKTMLVLGSLNRGHRTFESIQKNTNLGSEELDTILGNLEKAGMLSVRQKRGVLGQKIELYPTDKGFKEYYS